MEGIGNLLKGQLPEGLERGCDIPTDPKEREQRKADSYNASKGNFCVLEEVEILKRQKIVLACSAQNKSEPVKRVRRHV